MDVFSTRSAIKYGVCPPRP